MGRPFAHGNPPVMTAFTGTDNLIVVHRGRVPGYTGAVLVAGFADIRGRHVRGGLAVGDGVIVATRTHANDFIVIHRCVGNPGQGGMTLLAFIGGVYMVDTLSAIRTVTVMTIDTRTIHFIVIGLGNGKPGRHHVAGAADVGGVDMVGGLAGGAGTVVAIDTD